MTTNTIGGDLTGAQQMPMQTPQDLFMHELSAMHSAEQQIVQMLEQAQGMVRNQQLKEGLRLHVDQSRQHAERVLQVMQQMGAQPHPIQCLAAQGLYQDLQAVIQSGPSPEVLEGTIVGGAGKTEHFEIAGYTGLVEKARAMGQNEAVQLLEQNLQEEQQMLRQIEQISTQLTQQMAAMPGMQPDQETGAAAT